MKTPTRQRVVAIAVTALLGVCLAALGGRLVYIYAVSSEALASKAREEIHVTRPIRPLRGNIFDRELRVLAGSEECGSVFADPKIVKDLAMAARKAAPILGLNAGALYRELAENSERRFVWLKRRVPERVADEIEALRIYGLGTIREGRRRYPGGSLAAHVLGFVGAEQQGLEGLERQFDELMTGSPGRTVVLTDRRRRPIWSKPEQFVPVRDGRHLVLTIDATVQAVAERALARTRATFDAEGACALVMDPATGELLAMASVPTFDPNDYADFPPEARRNRAVTDTFPPGSVAKPIIAATALEKGVVGMHQTVDCENGYWPAKRLRDAGHSYGRLPFPMVVIKSSNIGMAKLGMRLGNRRLHAALTDFGFGTETGIRLPGEVGGLVRPVSQWTSYSTTRIPFGQEFSATPLQTITAFAALANGGRLVRPRVVRYVVDTRGGVVRELSRPEVRRRVLREDVARTMVRDILTRVVSEGTGKAARIEGYKVFGKTGTAQGVDPETGAVSHTRYIASFLAGAPAADPRVVVLVLVDRPDKRLGYYGGTVAAPAAREILAETLRYLDVPREGEDALDGGPPTILVDDATGP